MTEIGISDYLIGVVIFAIVIVSGVIMFGQAKSVDSSFMSDSSFNSFNQSMDIYEQTDTNINNLKTNINDSSAKTTGFGVIDALFKTTWSSLKLTANSFTFMDETMKRGLTGRLGVDKRVVALLISIIVIIIAFTIFGIITGTRSNP